MYVWTISVCNLSVRCALMGLYFFRSLTSVGNASRFVISEANSNTLVFDVTDALNVKRVEADLNGSELSFTIPAGRLREFVLVQTIKHFLLRKSWEKSLPRICMVWNRGI